MTEIYLGSYTLTRDEPIGPGKAGDVWECYLLGPTGVPTFVAGPHERAIRIVFPTQRGTKVSTLGMGYLLATRHDSDTHPAWRAALDYCEQCGLLQAFGPLPAGAEDAVA